MSSEQSIDKDGSDMKPQNVLLTTTKVCKLADFGLSAKVTKEGCRWALSGSPCYMAGELFLSDGYCSHAQDTYATAVSLFYLLGIPFPSAGEDVYSKAMGEVIAKNVRSIMSTSGKSKLTAVVGRLPSR